MKHKQEQALNEYLKDLEVHGRSVSNARYNLRIFFRYINDAGLNFLRLKMSDAQDFQLSLVTKTKEDGMIYYSKGSVLTILGSVTGFYDFLKKRRYVFLNPFKVMRKIKQGKILPRNILNEADMERFLKHLKRFWNGGHLKKRRQLYRAHVISELMYSTGMRINEVMKLKSTDIDFTRGTVLIHDSKTGSRREGILNSFTEKVLKIYIDEMREHVLDHKSDKSLLFGAEYSLKRFLNSVLDRESKELGLGSFSSHNFRHAVGYHLLREGCDIRYIQEILGHRKLCSTQIYTRVDREDLKHVLDEYHPRVLRIKQEAKSKDEAS